MTIQSNPITSVQSFPSVEAVHAYDLSCPSYVFDFQLASYSNQCDPPSTYSCGARFGGYVFDIPASIGDGFAAQSPSDAELDCVDWTFKGELWKQAARSPTIILEEEWGGYGVWTGTDCDVNYFAWSTGTPPFKRTKQVPGGFDRYRIVISTLLRGTPQQVQATLEPTPLP